MDYTNFFQTSGFQTIAKKLEMIVIDQSQESLELLNDFFKIEIKDTFGKPVIIDLICKAFIQKGPTGVFYLVSKVNNETKFRHLSYILRNLWYSSKGKLYDNFLSNTYFENSLLVKELTDDTIKACKEAFSNLIIQCLSDYDMFSSFCLTLYQLVVFDDNQEVVKAISNSIIKKSICLTDEKISLFRDLLKNNTNEEEYQVFFEENLIFINPLAYKVFNKHKLGDDLITDFVVKTFQDEYILVEIEKPQDKIFTKKGSFSSSFTHAYNQVLEFLLWIDDNVSYAQKKLPGISCPTGLLIMGRSNDLNERELKKLRYFNANSTRIKVLTYDDLLKNAEKLYQNLYQ